VTPSGLKQVAFRYLPAIEQLAVTKVFDAVFHAHSPQTLNHRAAAIVVEYEDGTHGIGLGVNCDVAMRGRNCAEPNALRSVERRYSRISAVVTGSWRNNDSLGDEPPVAPCGPCRADLLAGFGEEAGRPGVDRDTRLVMVPTTLEFVNVVTMQELLPFSFLRGPFAEAELRDKGVASLEILKTDAEYERFAGQFGLTLADFRQAGTQAAFACRTSVVPISNHPVGTAVILGNGQIVTGRKFDGVMGRGAKSAEMDAILSSLPKNGAFDPVMFISVAPDREDMGGLTIPDSETLQAIFHFAQVVGRDVPLVLARLGKDELVVIKISDLFRLGEGPVDSSSMRKNLHKYRPNGQPQV
jgi:cytidine deaminase